MTTEHRDFVQFIAGLADAEGETALLLRQKPVMQNGEMVFHGDGVPKATFPAFLPDKAKIRPGEAWYVNTGSFIIDRFEDGKPSARRENTEFVLFMMLDDVGTKSKVPPLPPTWIMETSEGSFQWGYAFSEQPTKHQFSAAIKAIAAAGYTDPGATNPVRNCRIPGSVNLKQGRNLFAARLIEVHTDREYTLDHICTALGVTPDEADSTDFKSIRIRDTGKDSVLQWLSDNGMVLSQVNNEGWCAVVCPNKDQHTDSMIEARYKPLDRSFCCYHGHCQHIGSKDYLAWVAANGGPEVQPGLRDELIAERMRAMADKLQPTEAYPDVAAVVVREVERKEAGRLERSEWFDRFAYIQSDDSYFDMATRSEIPRHVFNALYRHVDCRSVHNPKRQVAASFYFDERRQQNGAKALVGVTYAPGEPVLLARDGLVYGNRWVDARPDTGDTPVSDSAVQRWLDHVEVLIPEQVEREHVLDAMAHKVQFPRIKINHAILHGGCEGSGKDTLWAPFLWAIGGDNYRNRSIVGPEGLASQWGYDLEAEVMVLNELREPEARERRALANRLKPIIAAPPETLTINRKGLHPYEMLNRVFVLAFTNDQLPISLPTQDRRWFAVWSRAPRMTTDAADAMWHWFEQEGGFAAVAGWLRQRDVARFSPSAPPPVTDWKLSMVEHSMTTAESFLVEMLKGRKGLFAQGVVGGPFHKLAEALGNMGAVPAGVKVYQPTLLHAFQEAGWRDMGRVASAEYGTKKHIFAAPDVADNNSKSELRRMVEVVATEANKV